MASQECAASVNLALNVDCAAVTECSITTWYPLHRSGQTFKTRLVPLSEAFVAYLQSDGPCVLPATARGAAVGSRGRTAVDDDCELSDGSDGDDDGGGAPRFPGVEAAIDVAIAAVGGVAFCKLNWSAPRDAAWMAGGNLRCSSAADVFALVAASEFAAHDACRAYDRCLDAGDPDVVRCVLTLALRAWRDLDASREFRCFVLDERVVAACQRKVDATFEDLDDDRILAAARATIIDLFDGGTLSLPRHCVVDVAIQGARAFLVDVNVASSDTDPLLFTWPDLLRLRRPVDANAPRPPTGDFELRVVDATTPVRPSEMSSFRAPLDVAAMAEAGGLDQLLAAMQAQQRSDSTSSSDGAGG